MVIIYTYLSFNLLLLYLTMINGALQLKEKHCALRALAIITVGIPYAIYSFIQALKQID